MRQGGATPEEPLSSPLARYIGKRFTSEELWAGHCVMYNEPPDSDLDWVHPELRTKAAALCAWELPHLIGMSFHVPNYKSAPEAFRGFLERAIPELDWRSGLADDSVAYFKRMKVMLRKYPFYHGTLPAGADECTGQALGLELFARAQPPEGFEVETWEEQRSFYTAWHRVHSEAYPTDKPPWFELDVVYAVVANAEFTWLGPVPWYF